MMHVWLWTCCEKGEGDGNEDGDVAVDVGTVSIAPMTMNVMIAVMNFPCCCVPFPCFKADGTIVYFKAVLFKYKRMLQFEECRVI